MKLFSRFIYNLDMMIIIFILFLKNSSCIHNSLQRLQNYLYISFYNDKSDSYYVIPLPGTKTRREFMLPFLIYNLIILLFISYKSLLGMLMLFQS